MNIVFIITISFLDYSYEVSTGIGYNSNVYTYSMEYIQDFMDQVRPYRFPFETYDDLEMSQNINLRLRNKFINRHTTTFSLQARLKHFLINKQKDYLLAAFGIRQSFGRWAVKIVYDLIPGYLIRYYRDPEGSSTEYAGCKVDYHEVTGKLSAFFFSNTNLHLYYSRMYEIYHDPFGIYDAIGNSGTAQFEKQISDHFDIKISYSFRASRNDTLINVLEDDIPDASYNQHSPRLILIFRQNLLLPAEITIGYAYKFRNYTSDVPADMLHFGRQDHIHALDVELDFRLRSGIRFECSLDQNWRKATSNINEAINEIKDYSQTRITGAIIFYY